MDENQYNVLFWLVDQLEEFAINSKDVGEDEMLNYEVNNIIRSASPLAFPPGYANNTDYCIFSYEEDGRVAYRYDQGEGFIPSILDNSSADWTHQGRSKPDSIAVHRKEEIIFA